MPELPDVEVFRRYLVRHALDQPVTRVRVRDPRVLQDIAPQSLGRRLRGRAFTETRRHGKNLFAATGADGPWLLLHFGMTGRLVYFPSNDPEPRHTSVRFDFDGGHSLAHEDPRKLGKLALVDEVDEYLAAHRLGPDALTLDPDALAGRAAKRRGSVKAWLMDQHALAGIGNVYADEILFQARLAPSAPVSRLERHDCEHLHEAIHGVVETAVAAGADPSRMPEDWLLPHRRRGENCPRCGGALKTETLAGRTTYFCPRCQCATG